MRKLNITVPEQPNHTMCQIAQPEGNDYDCGMYHCMSLNQLLQQFTCLTEINEPKTEYKSEWD